MPLLTGEPRSAGVRAVTKLSVLKLSKDRFDNLLTKHHSLAVYFSGILAKRLASAHRDLTYCKELIEKEGKLEGQIPGPTIIWRKPKSRITQSILNKPFLGIILAALLCSFSAFFLHSAGIHRANIILIELILAAAVIWSMDIFSYYVVAIALPVLAVLLGATTHEKALSGFSSPAWFLVLGVFAISATISKTGLLYRLVLLIIRHFPPSYAGETVALAFSGLILTPVIPSSVGRSTLSAPVALTLSETLLFKDRSPGSIGLAMSCLLGFGHMSFMYLNELSLMWTPLQYLPA
jgi:branched-chain amino acid transport system substrate-binding protein